MRDRGDPPAGPHSGRGVESWRALARLDFALHVVRFPLVRHVFRDSAGRAHAAVLEGSVWVDGGLFRLHLLAPPTPGDAFPAGTTLNLTVAALDATAESLLERFAVVCEPAVERRSPSDVPLLTLKLGLRPRAA